MRYRQLGQSGLTVSVVGLGCNNFGRSCDLEGTRAVVDAALDAGVTLLDTADIYAQHDGSSEELLGQVLGRRRGDVVLATKFGMDMKGLNGPDWGARGSRRYIRLAVEASLRRLRTDWIDLYQYHVPDGITPIEETLAALHELVVEGKVRYLGWSNVAGWQVADADWIARSTNQSRFISVQNHYSLLDRGVEGEVVPACERFGLGLLPYFPLANGLLTGKYRLGQPLPTGTRITERKPELASTERLEAVERLIEYGEERGRSILEVAIAGLAAQPAVSSVIAGATSPEQVRANAAAGAWEPTAEDLAALDKAVPSGRAA
jgi:aryl-alcohol dehydrogenase-like predicted oxidoreductase